MTSPRVFAIGDIHGCVTALDALLRSLQLIPEDHLVFLGDYIDRGPDSAGVLDRLVELERRGLATCLLGNHEQMLLDAEHSEQDRAFWLQVGGAECLASYAGRQGPSGAVTSSSDADVGIIDQDHLHFLRERCLPFAERPGFIFTHATLLPDVALDAQPDDVLRWLRFGDPPPHHSGKTLVCGHTVQRDGVPRDLGHAVCIDTYCYGGGWLTAFDLDAGLFHQANEHRQTRVVKRRPASPL